MEFPFYISKVLPLDQDGFAILDAASPSVRHNSSNTTTYNSGLSYIKSGSGKGSLAEVIDKIGEASSKAQGLGHVITNYSKFISSGDNRLYIKAEGNKVYGILKMGKKNLFYYDGQGRVKELRPLCVLDFYVHESVQRMGLGKALFEKMLEKENVEPRKLAIDRPSEKFVSFLQKHYGLVKYVPQNNNFLVFDAYWDDTRAKPQTSNTNQKQIASTSFQDSREKKQDSYKNNTQTDKYNVGKIGSRQNDTYSDNNFHYTQQNQSRSRTPQNITTGNNIAASTNSRTLEQKTYGRMSLGEKANEDHKSVDTDTQLKLADEAYMKKNQQTNDLNTGKGKPQVWNTSYEKPPQVPVNKAPWGSFGTNMNDYRSSSAYGSHYLQGNSKFWKK